MIRNVSSLKHLDQLVGIDDDLSDLYDLSRRTAEHVCCISLVRLITTRVRQRVLEKIQLWGPSFSLSRQFEFHDPRNRYCV